MCGRGSASSSTSSASSLRSHGSFILTTRSSHRPSLDISASLASSGSTACAWAPCPTSHMDSFGGSCIISGTSPIISDLGHRESAGQSFTLLSEHSVSWSQLESALSRSKYLCFLVLRFSSLWALRCAGKVTRKVRLRARSATSSILCHARASFIATMTGF